MALGVGGTLGGRYRLERRVAVGGMGEVWQACDLLLERAVAVKIPRPEYAADPEFHRRFQDEARHAAALTHPHVATVFDFGTADEAPYLVMELVEGRSVADHLADRGRLPPAQVRCLLEQVGGALDAAHRAGICHRDVKPGNLLLRADGSVVVTDFGIARAVDAAAMTQTGSIFATACYISPEQVRGEPAGPASDLYALGVVAHECLTGSRPFDGELLAVLAGHRAGSPPPLPPDVPPDLTALVGALLSKDPERRPTAAELCRVAGEPVAAPPPNPSTTLGDAAPAAPASEENGGSDDRAPTRALSRELLTGARRSPLVRDPAPARQPVAGARGRPLRRVAAGREGTRRRSRWPELIGAAALVALVAAVSTISAGQPQGRARTGTGPAAARPAGPRPVPVPVVSASLYHPGGSDQDHPGDVSLAYDGNPATAWRTQHYASATFGNLRPGVGLVFDLGRPVAVRRVDLALTSGGTTVEVHRGPDLTAPTVLRATSSAAPLSASPAAGAPSRYWLVWISRLPPGGQAGIAEVRFTA